MRERPSVLRSATQTRVPPFEGGTTAESGRRTTAELRCRTTGATSSSSTRATGAARPAAGTTLTEWTRGRHLLRNQQIIIDDLLLRICQNAEQRLEICRLPGCGQRGLCGLNSQAWPFQLLKHTAAFDRGLKCLLGGKKIGPEASASLCSLRLHQRLKLGYLRIRQAEGCLFNPVNDGVGGVAVVVVEVL